MAANDTAALVVALSAQVSKFQKDMDEANKIADKSVKAIEDRFEAANRAIGAKLSSLSYTASSQLGTVGSVLRTLGPIGTTVAVSFGAAALAFKAMVSAASELAEKARGIREFAESTGLTTTEVQALTKAAGKVGVTSEEAQGFVTKLTSELDQLRRGQGGLREQLLRVNPALVDQLEVTKSTADAITVLGKAYKDLDTFQTAALSRAIGGRGAAGAVTRLLPGLDLGEATRSLAAAGTALDENLIKRIAQLDLDIQKMSKKARENIISIFAEDVLTRQREFSQKQLEISEQVKNFKLSDDFKQLLRDYTPSWIQTFVQMLPVLRDLQAGVISKNGAADGPKFTPSFDEVQNAEKASTALSDINTQLALIAATKRALGQKLIGETDPDEVKKTATAIAQLDARYKELKSSRNEADNPTNIGTVTPSAAAQLQAFRESISLREGDLSLAEQQRLKQLEQNAAIEANQRVAVGAAAGMRAFTLAQQNLILAIKEQLGVATEQEIVETRIANLRALQAKGIIDDAGKIAQAEAIIRKEAKETAEQLQVRASNLPQVTRYLLDAKNASKQLDQTLANAFGAGENAFADFVTGAKSARQAFSDFANSVLRDIAKMAFRSLLGGLFGTATGGGLLSSLFGGGRASGGPVEPGKVYRVNENTPNSEWFIPSSPGRIVPNEVVKSNGGGGLTFAPVTTVDARGSSMTEDQFKSIVEANNQKLARQFKAALPSWQREQALLGG